MKKTAETSDADGKPARSRVIVVDDDADVLDLVGMMLKSKGLEVVTSHNGDEALNALETHSDIDIALIDFTIPGTDTPHLITDIHRLYPNITILVMSGFTTEQVRRSTPPVISGYLDKPFTPRELMEALERARQS